MPTPGIGQAMCITLNSRRQALAFETSSQSVSIILFLCVTIPTYITTSSSN